MQVACCLRSLLCRTTVSAIKPYRGSDISLQRALAALCSKSLLQRAAVDCEVAEILNCLLQENWFNYGAASEKWIPPERRLHPRSDYREMEGKRDVPFHWNPTPDPARVSYTHLLHDAFGQISCIYYTS